MIQKIGLEPSPLRRGQGEVIGITGIRKLVLLLLIATFSNAQLLGQCQPNEIALIKSGDRDWVKDFDKLVKKFGNNEKTNSLRPFFYENDRPKTCISFTNLQSLESKLEVAFPILQYQNDLLIRNFTAAVKSIAASNPPLPESTTAIQESPISATDSVLGAQAIVLPPDPRTDLEQLQSSKTIWMIAALLAGISAVAVGVFYFFQTKKLKETIELQTQQLIKLGNTRFEADKHDSARETTFKNDAKQWREKYLASDHQLREISDEFAKYKERTQPVLQKKTGSISKKSEAPVVAPDSVQDAFYLSLPTATDDGNGSFRDMRQLQPNPTSSYYKFVENSDGKTAKFWFLENQNTVQSALVYPDTYINPACEYQNFNSAAKGIKTNEPGLAEKQGENWKVVRKAKIRFV